MNEQQVSVELDAEGSPFEVVVNRNPVTREMIVQAISRNKAQLEQAEGQLAQLRKGTASLEEELVEFDRLIPPAPVKKKRRILG